MIDLKPRTTVLSDAQELATDYCELSVVGGAAGEIMKGLKSELISQYGAMKSVDVGMDSKLEIRETTRSSINIPELRKLCQHKNVEVGKKVIVIRPKNSKIPAKVLESLDKYFTLEESLDVKMDDIKEAVAHGLLTEKEQAKVVSFEISWSLYPKLSQEFKDKVING